MQYSPLTPLMASLDEVLVVPRSPPFLRQTPKLKRFFFDPKAD
jgi:hypothetical protein